LTRAAFCASPKKWGTQRREDFLIPSSLWRISLIVGAVTQKCCAITRAEANGYLSRNASSCDPKVKSRRPGREWSLQDKSAFLNLWSQVLICDKW
jgi:hypothetical protein